MNQKKYYKNIDQGCIGIQEELANDGRFINIVMEPYKAQKVIENMISWNDDKRILYLSFKAIELNTKTIYERLFFDNFEKISKSYDFIIIDDISFYSNYNKAAITEIIDLAYKMAEKILIFSIDIVIAKSETLYITTQDRETHFKEPRIIVSRFDLRERIPYVFYTYLEWFYSKGENVIIYVQKEKAEDVYNKFLELEKEFKDIEIINYSGKSSELYNSLNDRKNSVIIHSNIQGLIDNIKNTNVIMYNDSRNFYSYKEVVFLCGRYSVLTEKKELILLSKKESENIDKAKRITRLYNEIAWRD
ncbi:hypothetical protein [uncultured Clostridium sp.]|uniref:hypothetical protein n=1 Tax=uncultured Clostridium sp. TaxID=59620 RepID=UPI002639D97F|nr:hypothetical protein [uncultured Clostridium sp.]